MSMADGENRLQKIAFKLGDKFYRFRINPENYRHSKPHRVTTVKTKSRIVVEDFGEDIQTITFSGTTGNDKGMAKIKEMKKFLEGYANRGGNGSRSETELYFHNFTNDEHYVVHLTPEGVTYTQDANQPLLHTYSISLFVLRRANEPPEDEVIEPTIGNDIPSIGDVDSINTKLPEFQSPIVDSSDPYKGDDTSGGLINLPNTGGNSNIIQTPYINSSIQVRPLTTSAVNPSTSPTAYVSGVTELKKIIGYGGSV